MDHNFAGDGPPPSGLKDFRPVELLICETTDRASALVPHQAKWLVYRAARQPGSMSIVDQLARTIRPDDKVAWIFADGSSNGGYGAVIVYPGKLAVKVQGHQVPTKTRNVGAELNAVLLGLRNVEEGWRVAVVCDYMGFPAWYSGNWKIKDPEVRDKITEARTIERERKLLVERVVHHRGHQKDDSEFTRWNHVADR